MIIREISILKVFVIILFSTKTIDSDKNVDNVQHLVYHNNKILNSDIKHTNEIYDYVENNDYDNTVNDFDEVYKGALDSNSKEKSTNSKEKRQNDNNKNNNLKQPTYYIIKPQMPHVPHQQLPPQPMPHNPYSLPYDPNNLNNAQLSGGEKTMEQFLDRLLHESVYDRRIRPFYKDGKDNQPVVVKMNMHINTISAINEVQMEYSVDCYFRQEWIDPRLNFANSSWSHVGDIALHYDLVNKVWTSDAFFRNCKDGKAHTITVPNRLMRIYPDGRVLYSQRLTLKLECPMKLQKFPLDNQTCIINIGSYGYTTKDLKFIWNRGTELEKKEPVTISTKLEMPDFTLKEYLVINCDKETATGSYACLEVSFILQRDLSVYINEFFIPSSFVVCLSFVSFFIDHKSAAARAPLGAMSVLTVTTMLSGSYACLEVHFRLTRSFGYYMVQVYIPSILTCLISFVSFWIDHRAVPARISVGLLTVLTVTTQSSGIRSQLPRVSYVKAIDVWMSACLVFVFAALLEYAVVNVIARKQELKKQFNLSKHRKRSKKSLAKDATKIKIPDNNEKVLVIGNRLANVGFYNKNNDYHEQNETLLPNNIIMKNQLPFDTCLLNSSINHHNPSVTLQAKQISPQSQNPSTSSQPSTTTLPKPIGSVRDDAQMVDFLSSFLFPIAFILFNIIYWVVYLNMQVFSSN